MSGRHLDGSLRGLRSALRDGAVTAETLIDEAAAGQDTGPMMGLPVSFKDIYGVAGMPIFAGSPRELPERWREEGPVVRAFRRQLAIVTGKTLTVEFAFGGVETFAHWPTPRYPWDAGAHRICGCSSTGPE